MGAQRIRLKRVYDPASPDDGTRVLVDRIWPRGVRKADAKVDRWLRNIAPSNKLRKWFHEDTEHRWDEFRHRYRDELANTPAFYELAALCREQPVTLLFASRNPERNQAVVLQELLSVTTAKGTSENLTSPVCYDNGK